MKKETVELLKLILPDCLLRLYRSLLGKDHFTGTFNSWQEASALSDSSNVTDFLESEASSYLKVLTGEAAFVRDFVTFERSTYWWPITAALLWIVSRNGNRLNLLDFGGSLGATYYQTRPLLGHLQVQWSIVELKEYVDRGRQDFENEQVRFYYDVDECIEARHPDAILLSGVIQYLEKPHDLLRELRGKKFKQLVLDRVPCHQYGDDPDRIKVQKVRQEEGNRFSPMWFFNETYLLEALSEDYRLVADFDSFDTFSRFDLLAKSRGFIFELKQTEEGT